MIKRIVKMHFQQEEKKNFEDLFDAVKDKIRGFPGCQYLELLTDIKGSGIYFTFSYWESEEALNAYRHSELFRETWKKTKAMFKFPAEAWSLDSHSKIS